MSVFVGVLEAAVSEMLKNSLENRPDFCDLLFSKVALTVFYDLKWEKNTSVWLIAALPPGFNIEASDMAKVYCRRD